MMLIGEFAFYLFMEVLMYSLGRVVIPIISLGRARALRAKEIFGKERPAYDEDGKMLIPEWATALVGVMTLTLMIVVLCALR